MIKAVMGRKGRSSMCTCGERGNEMFAIKGENSHNFYISPCDNIRHHAGTSIFVMAMLIRKHPGPMYVFSSEGPPKKDFNNASGWFFTYNYKIIYLLHGHIDLLAKSLLEGVEGSRRL